jgi:hypothetical protein
MIEKETPACSIIQIRDRMPQYVPDSDMKVEYDGSMFPLGKFRNYGHKHTPD